MEYSAHDILLALDRICSGRVVLTPNDLMHEHNQDVVTKTSHIPGKTVTELPGLIFGGERHRIGSVGLAMTMTENVIELAGGLGLDALIIHHPVADAASSGGVLIDDYLNLYGLALFELHEAFHGNHPGVAYLHGFNATTIHAGYKGRYGVNVYVGATLDGVDTLGDVLDRLWRLMSLELEHEMLAAERQIRSEPNLAETLVASAPELLVGDRDRPARVIAQFAPHSGFDVGLLDSLLAEIPEIDTLIAAKGRLKKGHPLVEAAAERGLGMLNGNSHAYEILENWMPLAAALEQLLPGLDIHVLRERVIASPYSETASQALREYAQKMADEHLLLNRRPEL